MENPYAKNPYAGRHTGGGKGAAYALFPILLEGGNGLALDVGKAATAAEMAVLADF